MISGILHKKKTDAEIKAQKDGITPTTNGNNGNTTPTPTPTPNETKNAKT